jgi:hypothetical protein
MSTVETVTNEPSLEPQATEVMTYREALRLALREELQRDEHVFIMGEEVGVFEGAYKVTAGLMAEFGAERVRDTPISEEGFVGAGVGAAMLGERPVVEIMTINFLLVAMDQVVNHAAKIGAMFGGQVRCPLVIRTPNGDPRRRPGSRGREPGNLQGARRGSARPGVPHADRPCQRRASRQRHHARRAFLRDCACAPCG